MSPRPARIAALALGALLAAPAAADVLLDGHQHMGDSDTTSDATAQFVPVDPVTKPQIRSYPSHFHLSQALTVTGITLHNPIGLDGTNQIKVQFDGVDHNLNTCAACGTCTGRQVCAPSITLTLTVPVALSAGVHTLAVYAESASNDFGFSAVTLVSTGTTTSRNLNQRRNVGDDDDANDNYDITDNNSPWYPDASAGVTASIPFSIDDNRRLVQIQFRRLRDLDTNNAQLLVDGLFIGNLANTGDPLEADPTTLSTGLLLTTGAHTLTVVAGVISSTNRDTMSWDDILLIFTDLTSPGTAGFFSAVDDGQPALTGSITTKVAGDARTLDLYALNGFGTAVETSYNGTASVVVLDATNNGGSLDIYGCRSSWSTAQSLGTVTFTAGEATLSPVFLDAGLREARVKVTDTTTGASGCSLDNFAVRPHSFTLSASHGTETTAGTTETLNNTGTGGTPRHKAGQPFTIQANAIAFNGNAATAYNGTPTLSATALAPATVGGGALVTTWQSLGGGALSTDTAKYLEAGPVRLALTDSDYASVDADDSTVAQRTIGPGSVDAGRFIPNHFTLTPDAPAFATACGSFTYVGQPFGIASPLRASITAVEAGGAVTRNYTDGGLYKLPASLPGTYLAASGVLEVLGTPPDPAVSNLGNGVARFEVNAATQLRFARGAPQAPFDAEVAVELGALNEGDGVNFTALPARLGQPAAGQGIAFDNGKQLRFGRLAIDNAHGSERTTLPVPLRAEYWGGAGGGFQRNTADNCTPLLLGDLTLAGSSFGPPDPPADTVPTLGPLSNGLWTLSLSAPGDPGFVDITAALGAALSWLQTDDADADTLYDDDPVGRATFGLSNDQDRRIFQREVVGF